MLLWLPSMKVEMYHSTFFMSLCHANSLSYICEIHRTTLSEQIKSLSVRALFATLRCAAEHLLPTFVDIEPRPAHVTNAVSNQTTTLTTSHYQKSKSLQNLHVQSKPFDVK